MRPVGVRQTRTPGFWLFEPPALGLFTSVVVPAERRDVAGTSRAAVVPGGGVVQVAAHGGPTAARGGARGVAGGDQVAELAAGAVGVLGLGVVTGTGDDRVELELSGVRGVRVPACGAGVGGGGAVGVQRGHAPPGTGVAGRSRHQVAGGSRIQQPESGRFSCDVGVALQGGQRHGDDDESRDARTGGRLGLDVAVRGGPCLYTTTFFSIFVPKAARPGRGQVARVVLG